MDSKSDDYREEGKYSESKDQDIINAKLTNNVLLQKVQEYFYTDDALLNTFESFAKENCNVIDLDTEEYKLKYTELYEEYKSLFESRLERYIHSLGATALDFYNALKEATDEDADSNDAVFGQILFAVSDFDIFMTMMRETAQAEESKARK